MNSTITNSNSTVSPSQTSRMRFHFGIFADNRWSELRKESVQNCTDPGPPAISMAPGQELDNCCAADSTDRRVNAVD